MKEFVLFLLLLLIVLGGIILVADCWFNSDETTLTPTATLALTTTDTPTPTPTWTPAPTTMHPSTLTLTPPNGKVVIEVDGVVADDDRCQEVDCGSSLRIEVVKVLDSAGGQIQPDVCSYNRSFNPSDPHNENKVDSRNYVINYYVPCELDNQTVTIEVLKDGETLGVRSIRFNIKKQP